MVKMRVKALSAGGFRRAKQFWPHEGRDVEVDEREAALLEAEPSLVCVRFPEATPELRPEPKADLRSEHPEGRRR